MSEHYGHQFRRLALLALATVLFWGRLVLRQGNPTDASPSSPPLPSSSSSSSPTSLSPTFLSISRSSSSTTSTKGVAGPAVQGQAGSSSHNARNTSDPALLSRSSATFFMDRPPPTPITWMARCGNPPNARVSFTLGEIVVRHQLMSYGAERILPPHRDPCRTGREKCVISISAYGSSALFWEGAINNIHVAHVVYPGWTVRIYHDNSISEPILARVRALPGVELVEELEIKGGKVAGMFWRFLVADDASVDRYIVRDADSAPYWRERAAVNAWMVSGKKFHFMRDHPCHIYYVLGGMWGGVKGALPMKLRPLILSPEVRRYLEADKYTDQDFLRDYLYNIMSESLLCHDSHTCDWLPGCEPFPVQNLLPLYFVGRNLVSTSDINITLEQAEQMGDPTVQADVYKCPAACRPKHHQDWEYC